MYNVNTRNKISKIRITRFRLINYMHTGINGSIFKVKLEKPMQNRSFAQYLHFRDFEILTSRKHSGCCGSEVAQALILNKIPGFAKPS